MNMEADALALLIQRAYEAGYAKCLEEKEERRIANAEAADALEHDDSEWADRQRGYGQSDSPMQNDAGEWIGYM